MNSQNKVALVTSAGNGVGRSIALRLARDGADISLLDSRKEDLDCVANEIKKLGRRAMVTVAPIGHSDSLHVAIEETVAAYGKFDIMVNNLSLDRALRNAALNLEDAEKLLTLNIQCTAWGIQAAARKFRELGTQGTIINVSSSAGYESSDLFGIYCASKQAMRALSRAASKELACHGIRVTLQCVGSIIPGAKYT